MDRETRNVAHIKSNSRCFSVTNSPNTKPPLWTFGLLIQIFGGTFNKGTWLENSKGGKSSKNCWKYEHWTTRIHSNAVCSCFYLKTRLKLTFVTSSDKSTTVTVSQVSSLRTRVQCINRIFEKPEKQFFNSWRHNDVTRLKYGLVALSDLKR